MHGTGPFVPILMNFSTIYGARRFITLFTNSSYFVTHCNNVIFYGEYVAIRSIPKLVDHPLSAISGCLTQYICSYHHIWRPSSPSAANNDRWRIRSIPKLEDYPLSAIRDCLIQYNCSFHHIWRPFSPSAANNDRWRILSIPKLEDYPLSAIRDCLIQYNCSYHHIWRPFSPSATNNDQ
jgi:hypothetical protein